MAMKPCPECKREISTDAATCPHCGKSQGVSGARIAKGVGVGCLALIAVTASLGYIFCGGACTAKVVEPGEVADPIEDSDLGTGCLREPKDAPSCTDGETAVLCGDADQAGRVPDVCTPNDHQYGFCCPLGPPTK